MHELKQLASAFGPQACPYIPQGLMRRSCSHSSPVPLLSLQKESQPVFTGSSPLSPSPPQPLCMDLIQAVPAALLERALGFPPLKTCRQLSPSFFEAPLGDGPAALLPWAWTCGQEGHPAACDRGSSSS
jgi:hypothetical protein